MGDPVRNNLKAEILHVLRNSDNMLRTFRSQIENKNVIIFIGNTRNGKSTLVNYITETPLVAFQEGDLYKIEHQNGANTGPTIGHGTLSHTKIPTIIELQGRPNTVIIDAPGFDDNRGTIQEIINALYINQIKYSKGVRFVLVSDINNIINDNINHFLSFIETVHTIMPDFVKLKDAVSIIFTKDSKNYDQLDIVELLSTKILNVNALHCKKNLIKHFVERQDLIGLFKMPSSAGALTEEININVHGAIFNSLPINLNETDIKFGISKSARVVLLETYLEFFDVVNSLTEIFTGFRKSAYNKFTCFHKKQLLELPIEQLQGEEGSAQEIMSQFQKRIKTEQEQLVSVTQIPDSLQQLFVEEVNRIGILVETVGVQATKGTDPTYNSNAVQEVREKLEYIICIEKVVAINNKSENLLSLYKESLERFHKEIKSMCEEIHKEVDYRNLLTAQIKFAHQMQNNLQEVDELYIFASFHDELLRMKSRLQQYINMSESIRGEIYRRPPLQQSVTRDICFTSSIEREIQDKLGIINRYIDNRNEEDLFKHVPSAVTGIMGTLMLYEGLTYIMTLGKYTQFAAIGSSLFLFATFSRKSTYMRNFYSRMRLRYQEKRLFTRSTKLDNCCKELEDPRRFFRR